MLCNIDAPPIYPCVYREHDILYNEKFGLCGLSLCIQGTRYLELHSELDKRFIPVHTGNTITPSPT